MAFIRRRLNAIVLALSIFVAVGGQSQAQTGQSSISDSQAKATSGDAAAQYDLGRAYDEGKGLPQNPKLAVDWYRKAAAQGNADAQNSLGVMYMTGQGVEEDRAEAMHWYHEAARQKNGKAMFNLGVAFYNGDRQGKGIDDAAAYAWFTLAKENGSVVANDAVARDEKELPAAVQNLGLLHIADMYLKGEELPKNPGEAQRWIRMAAERGDSEAQMRLAAMLVSQEKPEYAEAYTWCDKAAKTGNAAGQYCLGKFYEQGLGIPKDSSKALARYELAASNNYMPAIEAAARMLATGQAGKQDRPKAFLYFIVLALDGNKDAVREAAKLRVAMTKKEWKTASEDLRHRGLDPVKVETLLANVPVT